jgi:hypothetical protein
VTPPPAPAGPVAPFESVAPVEPVAPVGPVGPVGPVAPVVPPTPVVPVGPVGPVAPVDPTKFVEDPIQTPLDAMTSVRAIPKPFLIEKLELVAKIHSLFFIIIYYLCWIMFS